MNINDCPLWTAIVSPMNNDGSIDYKSFEVILRQQEDAGNGILVLGSTGESLNLDLEEKKKILDFALNLKLKAPIMCGIGGANINTTSSWLEYLETKNIDCYLMVTPLYAKPESIGQYEWFKTLMDKASKPVVLYNVPSRTGKDLSLKTLKMLEDHPRLWGIKEASGCVDHFKKYRDTNKSIKMFSGDDAMMPVFCEHGCDGLISVASNAWPKETNLYVKKCLDKSLEDKTLWEDCSNSLFCVSNPIPVKRLLFENKYIESPCLRLPLHDKDLTDIKELLKSNELITNWYNKEIL